MEEYDPYLTDTSENALRPLHWDLQQDILRIFYDKAEDPGRLCADDTEDRESGNREFTYQNPTYLPQHYLD
ncbi:MAG: hypothetical protein V1792_15535 [Pseudomonadota bacterium]